MIIYMMYYKQVLLRKISNMQNATMNPHVQSLIYNNYQNVGQSITPHSTQITLKRICAILSAQL